MAVVAATSSSCIGSCAAVQVHAPSAIGDIVDLSSGTATCNLRLRNTLYAALDFVDIGGFEAAYVDSVAVIAKTAAGAAVTASSVSLGAASAASDHEGAAFAALTGHEPTLLHDGVVRLPELRRKLVKHGIECDFVEGGLVTRGGIVVRKGAVVVDAVGSAGLTTAPAAGGSGIFELDLEGPVCDEYFAVRNLLYGMYVLL